MTTAGFVPFYPVGDPDNDWRIDEDDFYRFVDAAFDEWYDSASADSHLGARMPYELTAREPEARPVSWPDDRTSLGRREWRRLVHPEVAAEAERLDQMHRPSKEDVEDVLFSPSPLACYRQGFSTGAVREKARANEEWKERLDRDKDGGWAVGCLHRAIRARGANYTRALLERAIEDVTRQDEAAEPPPQLQLSRSRRLRGQLGQ